MNDLDDKLREILLDRNLGQYMRDINGHFVPVDWEGSPVIDEFVGEIKQAFIDARWNPGILSLTDDEIERLAKAKGVHKGTLMTGQEWHNRFKALAPKQLTETDELDFNLHDDDTEGNCYYAYNCAIAEMNKAAKKAAGIQQ